MSIEQASAHLKLGKTVLYAMAREGKIPASKVGSKWLFDANELNSWVKARKPISSYFMEIDASIEENLCLREPQIEAYKVLYQYFKDDQNREAIIQIPVGCGKSGIAAIVPFGISRGRVLVIAPNLIIKDGLFESLDVSNRQKCFWRKRKILQDKDMVGGPYTSTLDTGNISTCEKSHIVVSNVQQLATNPEKWLTRFPKDFFDLIIVDEAHHSAAVSWKIVLEHFHNARVINMTATPFRSDKQKITGELVYRYPFKKATFNGYIKNIKAWYVAPSELTFTAKGETKTYSLDEVLTMKEKDWFSRGIALSEICNQSIVDNSLEKLEELRQTGTHHQLIAVACSVDHARSIRSLYAARGFKAEVIYSQVDEEKKSDVMRMLKSGELDCIIQVQMLGEGFDHPKLSVAAIFRPFRTLAPYIQFVGRILRVVVQGDPRHPDNYGHVVTHAGMNLDQRLKEFKLFEKDDQKFWEEIIEGKEPEPPSSVTSGQSRMKLQEPAVANHEIVDSLLEEEFTSADDEDIIEELAQKMELLGLNPALARDIVLKQQNTRKSTEAAEPFPVLPQREWKEAKRRLNESVNRSANLLINRLNLKRSSRDLVNLGVNAKDNFVASVMLINQELRVTFPEDRVNWTTDQFKTATSKLEDILNKLTRRYKKKLDGKAKR